MGNFMIGNFYPPFLGRIDKIMCGNEQCWPTTNIVIPQGGFCIRYNEEVKEFFTFADLYENYDKMAVGEWAEISRSFDISITFNISVQIVGTCSIYKGADETNFQCRFTCRYSNYTKEEFIQKECYYGYPEHEGAVELTDLDRTYIWDIYANQSSMSTYLQSSDKTLYKNYGKIYIVRERDWESYNSHELIASCSLINEFLPLWNAGAGSSRKNGYGTFALDGQPFSGQDYTWLSVSTRSQNTDTTTLTITLGDLSRTLTFVDNSETPAPVGNYGLCQDHVVLITSTGPIVYSYWPQSLQREFWIANWWTFHNTQAHKYNRGADTNLTTTWIDLILYKQSPSKQRILNHTDYIPVGDYSSWWWYNVKDNSLWRKVQIVDMHGVNILDTSVLVNGMYKVDPFVPKWYEPDLPPILMRVNDDYEP